VGILVGITLAWVVLVSILVLLVAWPFAIIVIPIAAVVGAVTCYFGIAWVNQAMDDFDGTAVPGFWGLLGYSIVPDGTDLSQLNPGPDYDDNELSGFSDTVQDPTTVPPPIVKRGCPKCGAVTEGVDPKVCRNCGAALEG
jgi:hypothetical protein